MLAGDEGFLLPQETQVKQRAKILAGRSGPTYVGVEEVKHASSGWDGRTIDCAQKVAAYTGHFLLGGTPYEGSLGHKPGLDLSLPKARCKSQAGSKH